MSKLAIVTGASRGIGAFLTLALAERGIDVIAISRHKDQLEKLKSNYPNKINILSADLSNVKELPRLANDILKYSSISYIVHNAGIITPIAPISTLSEENVRTLLETNLISPILLTNQLLPHIHTGGRILNVSSVAACKPVPGLGPYCISKAGINMWTQIIKNELEYNGIFVASVIPGEVDTSMQKDLREAPITDFPLVTEFKEAYKYNTLIPPNVCASFLAWLLLSTTDEEFSKKEWNIYDDWHHQFWLKGKLPLPLNREKLAVDF